MLYLGGVIRCEWLLDEIWGWDYPVATRAADVRIAELHKALHDDTAAAVHVETRIDEGCCFVGEELYRGHGARSIVTQ
ncbi:MAG TPA: helix-turn-helix domain-containing protein [Anaerolineae bacterium]|nr:helix-turn-helix domain-containing protein [Anaerolineae bacterium]HOR01576.1 helix-turn-helix domain-containing protein [Anaerolineae bacterium]HPL30505.1 helix-turn-helix domain-containing protein [Anaerolineae bacterium]